MQPLRRNIGAPAREAPLASRARAIVRANRISELVAQRNAVAAELAAARPSLEEEMRRLGFVGRLVGSTTPAIEQRRRHCETLTERLSGAERALTAARERAFSELPPLAIVAAVAATSRIARAHLTRPAGEDFGCLAREREIADALTATAKRLVDTWVPGFEPARFVARCRADRGERRGRALEPLSHDRWGFRPIDEVDLQWLATQSAGEASDRELFQIVANESRIHAAHENEELARISHTELENRALLARVSAYPPMAIWFAAQKVLWLLHGTAWPPSERVLSADAKFRYTTILLLRAWQLALLDDLERATEQAFPGVGCVLGAALGRAHTPPASRALAACAVDAFAARAWIHASVAMSATFAKAESAARIGTLDRLAVWSESPDELRERTAGALAQRHREGLARAAVEQARSLRALTRGSFDLRVRDQLVAICDGIDAISTTEGNVSMFTRHAPVYGRERALAHVSHLRSEVQRAWQLHFTIDVLAREVLANVDIGPPRAAPRDTTSKLGFQAMARQVANALRGQSFRAAMLALRAPLTPPAHEATAAELAAWQLLFSGSKCYPPLELYLSLSLLTEAVAGVRGVVVRRIADDTEASYCALFGLGRARQALEQAAQAALVTFGPMPADGEILCRLISARHNGD